MDVGCASRHSVYQGGAGQRTAANSGLPRVVDSSRQAPSCPQPLPSVDKGVPIFVPGVPGGHNLHRRARPSLMPGPER